MAMKILDTISNESKELQDKTKAEMAQRLLSSEPTSLSGKSIDRESSTSHAKKHAKAKKE
jgi:hypothetical protein